jgi:hypothetical protein
MINKEVNTMIPQVIKDSFNRALLTNRDIDGEIDWCGVDADMNLDLKKQFDSCVIFEAMNMLADIYEKEAA